MTAPLGFPDKASRHRNSSLTATVLQGFGYQWDPNLRASDAQILILVASVWKHICYDYIFLVAAMLAVPQSLREAAAIDGAGAVKRFLTMDVERPKSSLDRKPSHLSGGQCQRVAVGRALVRKPRAFLFDEPLSNLDARLRGHIRIEIRNLQRRLGTTSVFVTHDQLEAMTLADTLVVTKGGRIEQVGTPFDVYNNPATTFVARFIGSPGMNIVRRSDIGVASDVFSALPSTHDLLGFRPEAITLGRTDLDGLKISAQIEGVEVLGPESLVHLHVPGVKDTIIAKVDTDPSIPVTGPIEFEVAVSDLYSFER